MRIPTVSPVRVGGENPPHLGIPKPPPPKYSCPGWDLLLEIRTTHQKGHETRDTHHHYRSTSFRHTNVCENFTFPELGRREVKKSKLHWTIPLSAIGYRFYKALEFSLSLSSNCQNSVPGLGERHFSRPEFVNGSLD